ncbi:MAG: S8 family serine peptidase [Alphaproteobacteria bacterium]|nr:S8 family serine peptidase [Alphaproteobacteria bacterium]
MRAKIRLGLVDSGVSDQQRHNVCADGRFTAKGYQAVRPDLLGHGTAICGIITDHAPDILLYNAQVFDDRGVTTAANVAAAIDWLVRKQVDIINLSLGLRHDRPVLAAACGRAHKAGIIMVASTPAQGAKTWPAAYPGVIRATGDARCGSDEISFLDSTQADFGGCPRAIDGSGTPGGASMGAAHISGQIAAYLHRGQDKNTLWHWLVSRANYIDLERRTF